MIIHSKIFASLSFNPIVCSVRTAIAKAHNDTGKDDFLSLRVKTKEEEVC